MVPKLQVITTKGAGAGARFLGIKLLAGMGLNLQFLLRVEQEDPWATQTHSLVLKKQVHYTLPIKYMIKPIFVSKLLFVITLMWLIFKICLHHWKWVHYQKAYKGRGRFTTTEMGHVPEKEWLSVVLKRMNDCGCSQSKLLLLFTPIKILWIEWGIYSYLKNGSKCPAMQFLHLAWTANMVGWSLARLVIIRPVNIWF